MEGLLGLPTELIRIIIGSLDAHSRGRLAGTCKLMYELAQCPRVMLAGEVVRSARLVALVPFYHCTIYVVHLFKLTPSFLTCS